MKRILLAYDGGEPAKRALELTIDLATRYGAAVGVISVVPVRMPVAGPDPWDDRELHTRQLLEAQDALRMHGIEPELIEPYGDPAFVIERTAFERRYDTVIVGTRGQSALERFLGGSVSEHVATHSEATVIVAH